MPIEPVDRLANRAQGLLMGTAVGDCLGRPVEGVEAISEGYIEELVRERSVLHYSDDTVLTMAVAESLLACDGFDGNDMVARFADAWHAEPHRGYGAGVVEIFGKVRRGVDREEAATSQFGGEGSFGNGGAMRVAPAALWAYPDLEATVRLARETAAVTHTHPVGIEGAVAQAVAAHHALKDHYEREALLSDFDRVLLTDRFRRKLEIFEECLGRADDRAASRQLGNGVSADRSVLTAVYCFVVADSFEETVRRAIGMGGDTDTIAAMAGALAGARYGATDIPEAWLEVEDRDRLLRLAGQFVSRLRSR